MIRINSRYIKEYDNPIDTNRKDEIKEKLFSNHPMTAWTNIDTTISKEEIKKIKIIRDKIIKEKVDILIVIGIGGSFLGAKAIIDSLNPYFSSKKPEIIFAGTTLSGKYLENLLNYIEGKNVYVNVISKSGNTLETAITFDLIEDYMKKTYTNYKERIIVTTDKENNSLRKKAVVENYETLNVPQNIGGRFSCLSVVGLLPVAISGIDIDKLLDGARNATKYLDDAFIYANIRYNLEKENRVVELITIYEENLESFGSWISQLFGETQGKNGLGILPVTNVYTKNLHSIGQYLQEGRKICFETVLKILKSSSLQTKEKLSLQKLNNIVLEQVATAHKEGQTPSLIIEVDEMNEYTLGELIYFFFLTAAIGGYLLEINPFNQPGVERYKYLVNEELKNVR